MEDQNARPEFSRGATFEDLIDEADIAYLREIIRRDKKPGTKKHWWPW